MKKQLSTLTPGTQFLYRERGAVVLQHTGGGVFVQLMDSIGQYRFGATNDWRTSELRKYLNRNFAKELCECNMDELLDTVTDLTAMDGTTDYGYSVDKLTLLTVDQCRKYRYTRSLLKEGWGEWTSTPDDTPSTPGANGNSFAWYLNDEGIMLSNNSTHTVGVRPAFTLPSSLTVKVLGGEVLRDFTDADLLAELLRRQESK